MSAECMRAAPTHALVWIPEWLLPPGSNGWWALQLLNGFDLGEPQEDDLWTSDLPRDASPDRLAEWAAGVLNHPVLLDFGGPVRMRERKLLTLPHREPMYWVTPVAITGWLS